MVDIMKEKIEKLDREDLEDLCIDLLEIADLSDKQLNFILDKEKRRQMINLMNKTRR